MVETPRFFQGVYRFEGRGLENLTCFDPPVGYTTPPDRRVQFLYGRVGNPTNEMIFLVLTRNGKPMRYFPCGARSGMNIQLFVIEDIEPDTRLDILIGAPEGLTAKVMIDFGMVEI